MPTLTRTPGSAGVTLAALSWVGGDARPFLLVHGLSSNLRTWEAVGDELAAMGHPVVAVDLRGHGGSDKPDSGYDFATMVDDLMSVLASLAAGTGPAAGSASAWLAPVVAGQSTGGNLAVELAARHPGAVAGVVGIDGGLLDLSARWPEWADCEAALAPPRFDGLTATVLRSEIARRHPTWSEAGVAATLANLEHRADGTVRPWLTRDRHLSILRALWGQRPLDLVATLPVDMLFVLASGPDGWDGPKRDAAAAAAANPRVKVEWLAGDHDLHVEQPETVGRMLVDLAGGIDG